MKIFSYYFAKFERYLICDIKLVRRYFVSALFFICLSRCSCAILTLWYVYSVNAGGVIEPRYFALADGYVL